MNLNLKNKVALITGGSHGIGLAIAQALAEEGCLISICGRNQERLDKAVGELGNVKIDNTQAIGIVADVLDSRSYEKVIKITLEIFGTIHILINNVGGGGRWGLLLAEQTPEEVWQEVYEKNTMAAVRFTRACLPYMRQQRWGRVVTIASIYGREGGGRPWFNMAKAAEISLMKSLALNPTYAREGITFNSVAPGAVYVSGSGWDVVNSEHPEELAKYLESLPMGRMGNPKEIANLVTFLCSDKASYINGSCVAIDGGESKSF